jgi:hypothetical protein
MRDDEDPGALELKLPRKRGRPPKLGIAMTDAQRASNYRQRLSRKAALVGRDGRNDKSNLIELSDAQLLEAIRMAMQEGNGKRVGMLCDQLKDRYAKRA